MEALSKALDNGIIDIADVLNKVEDMTKKKILEQRRKVLLHMAGNGWSV